MPNTLIEYTLIASIVIMAIMGAIFANASFEREAMATQEMSFLMDHEQIKGTLPNPTREVHPFPYGFYIP